MQFASSTCTWQCTTTQFWLGVYTTCWLRLVMNCLGHLAATNGTLPIAQWPKMLQTWPKMTKQQQHLPPKNFFGNLKTIFIEKIAKRCIIYLFTTTINKIIILINIVSNDYRSYFYLYIYHITIFLWKASQCWINISLQNCKNAILQEFINSFRFA